jgi:uncharacterized membrane protein YfcA
VDVLEALAILGAGAVAGTMNAVVGSGTLVTFPVLLAFGYAPVTANVSNTVGLVPGSVAGAYGYRSQLAGQRRRAIGFGVASLLGGFAGAVLLLALPASAFRAIVPGCIGLALVLVVAQPWLARRLAARRDRRGRGNRWALPLGLFLIGVYGGYFGAAQGILMLAVFGLALSDGLQRANALKNVLAGGTNLVAGAVFLVVADIAWGAALLIAAGSILGGVAGARIGLRLPAAAYRGVIVAVGTVAIVKLVAG